MIEIEGILLIKSPDTILLLLSLCTVLSLALFCAIPLLARFCAILYVIRVCVLLLVLRACAIVLFVSLISSGIVFVQYYDRYCFGTKMTVVRVLVQYYRSSVLV